MIIYSVVLGVDKKHNKDSDENENDDDSFVLYKMNSNTAGARPSQTTITETL